MRRSSRNRTRHESCREGVRHEQSVELFGEIRAGAPVDGPEWVDAYERYRFTELADGGTRLEIELLNLPAEYAPMMNEMWPKALERLRQICVAA